MARRQCLVTLCRQLAPVLALVPLHLKANQGLVLRCWLRLPGLGAGCQVKAAQPTILKGDEAAAATCYTMTGDVA